MVEIKHGCPQHVPQSYKNVMNEQEVAKNLPEGKMTGPEFQRLTEEILKKHPDLKKDEDKIPIINK